MNELFTKPVKDLTIDELREGHRALWDFLAKNPRKEKEHFFENAGFDDIPLDFCYACALAKRTLMERRRKGMIRTRRSYCDYCPCVWHDRQGNAVDFCLYGEFGDWDGCSNESERSELAIKIRDAWPAAQEQSNE
jgi:hypothetical protein